MSHEEQTNLRIRRTHQFLQSVPSSGGWRAKRTILPDKWPSGFGALRFFYGYLSAHGYEAPTPGKE